MKPVHCLAKRHTVILHPVKGSATDVIFSAESKDGSEPTGQIEERKKGLFGYNSVLHPLQAENRFRIGTFTNGFRLAVIADKDVTIRFKTRHTQVLDVVRYIAIGSGGLLAIGIAMNVLGIAGPEESSDIGQAAGPGGELQKPAESDQREGKAED
jgi:hypothetical protein